MRNQAKAAIDPPRSKPHSKPRSELRKKPGAGRGHTIALLVFEESQMLDVAGPADAFHLAGQYAPELSYRLLCVSARGGAVRLSNGFAIQTQAVGDTPVKSIDTLIVTGAAKAGLERALADEALRTWVCAVAARAQRIVSVCVGSFAIAHWGLLDGLRVTTHWSVADLLQRLHPQVQVDRSALFVRDGRVWTAGGVTTGIDMSLAIIEADSSRLVAGQVAGALVMSARRVGNQSQYSAELRAQSGRYAALIDWISSHLREPHGIASLAARAGESERTFCRRFHQAVGRTPARLVEDLRLQAAKRRLEGGATVKAAALASGFASAEHLARAFRKRLAMSPAEYRSQHGPRAAAAA